MDESIKTTHELCEIYMDSLKEAKNRLKKSGGPISVGDADYMDKLTHTIKSLETTAAMKEAKMREDGMDDGYSGRYMPRMGAYYGPGGMSYASDGRGGNRGNSYEGMSYARGQRRDSMGRYSREGGYSYADGMEELLGEMRDMLPGLSDEKRRRAERLIDELQG